MPDTFKISSSPTAELIAKNVAKDLTAAARAVRIGMSVLEFCYHPLPTVKLQDLRCARGFVRDAGEVWSRLSRIDTQHDYLIEISLRIQVDCDKAETVSHLKRAMEDVRDYFYSHPLTARPEQFNRVDSVDAMDDEEFKETQVVKGVTVLVFRGYKEHS